VKTERKHLPFITSHLTDSKICIVTADISIKGNEGEKQVAKKKKKDFRHGWEAQN